jgi:AAA domain
MITRLTLVGDEAGVAGTGTGPSPRPGGRHDAKIVLVGNPRQLPEIDASDAFAARGRRLDPIGLTDNCRQQHPWERAAHDQLAPGR